MTTLDFFAEIDRVTRELYKEESEVKPLGNYSVWVEGIEIERYMGYQDAIALRNEYLEDGYNNVEIDTYEEDA
jgi:hypothetical protein